MYIAGQCMGWIATLLTFLSYQCKSHNKLIVVQTLSSLSICISYFFLNAWSGMLLNIVCIVRNFIIYRKDIKFFSYSFWPYVLSGIMGIMGIVSWQGPMSLLIVVGLAVNTLFLYFPNVQNLRKSILVTSTMILIYNVYYTVWGGVANEMLAIISSLIGIYRYKNVNRKINVHNMKLHSSPFEMIKRGDKTIELRLFDEKRQQIKAGDKIVFTNTTTGETLDRTVVKLHRFDRFEELYKSLPLLQCGYTTEDIDHAKPSDMERYYSLEEQKKYGVVGIELC